MPDRGYGELIPGFAESILHVGDIRPDAATYYDRRTAKVWHLQRYAGCGDALPGDGFDCIVLDPAGPMAPEGPSPLAGLVSRLTVNGRISLVYPARPRDDDFLERSDARLLDMGLLRFKSVQLSGPAGDGDRMGIVAVRREYNPVSHARDLALHGRFEQAIDVLACIPHDLIPSDEHLSLLAAETQRLYLEWQRALPAGQPVHTLFFKARREFAQVTAALPHHHPAYRCEADFWRHIGNTDMARRTLRSLLHVAPDEATRRDLTGMSTENRSAARDEEVPEWRQTRRPPRILILTHDFSDYGVDTLYDGLCRVIGTENVTEYPWKPMLHGLRRDAVHNYPCAFNHPSERVPLERLLVDLRDQRYDLILYADVVQMTRPEEVRRILEAGRDLPLVVYDSWDDCYTPLKLLSSYTGGKEIGLVFKREMITGVDYGPRTFPLPFGYPDPLVPDLSPSRGGKSLFWAGKRVWGLRPLYLPQVEKTIGRTFRDTYDQAEYSRQLCAAGVGLSLSGSGFDSVRYWEIPAHGVMLLAERPPIRIPRNFRDAESAVFFDDLPDLEAKLRYYLSQPEEARQIALEGHRHFMAFHTTSARARQFLGRLEEQVRW